MKKLHLAVIIFSLFLISPLIVHSHSGRLDSRGGHRDRETGEYHFHRPHYQDPIKSVPQNKYSTVVRVIDGDTVVLDGGEKIRLIGVDTPETKDPRKRVQYFGKEATSFTKKMVEGKEVRLEFDEVNMVKNHKDKYGRALAYIYLKDGTFLNAEIIRQGYGHAYTKYPFKYLEEFRSYEREARENQRGLWK